MPARPEPVLALDAEPFLPPGFAEVARLFGGDLAQVQFPGIDAGVLAEAAARVASAAAQVAERERELANSRAQLRREHDEALARAQRALAYARIFAQDNPELTARLAELKLGQVEPPATSTSAPLVRRRGRPPKSASASSLFAAPDAELTDSRDLTLEPDPVAEASEPA